jgi:hypothetical protein
MPDLPAILFVALLPSAHDGWYDSNRKIEGHEHRVRERRFANHPHSEPTS